jgi:hypothetical protein
MRRRIYKFLHLQTDVKILLFKSFLLLSTIRLGLWILPFQKLRHVLAKRHKISIYPEGNDRKQIKNVVWAVTLASRYVPSASCLTQALAVIVLLNGVGHRAQLRIGVAKGTDGKLEAHAWVEMSGEIILGEQGDLSRFSVLSPQTEIL